MTWLNIGPWGTGDGRMAEGYGAWGTAGAGGGGLADRRLFFGYVL